MKNFAFAVALLAGSAAFAQVDVAAEPAAYEGDGAATAAFETEGASASYAPAALTTADSSTATRQIVEPSNSDPERDARGIAVISAAALVPAGWNGTAAGAAMGGPELDAVTGEAIAPDAYPACTASVTDKCLQTYERGRH
jgi:hypothetical protein